MKAKKVFPWILVAGGLSTFFLARTAPTVGSWLKPDSPLDSAQESETEEERIAQDVPHLTYQWRQVTVAKARGAVVWSIELKGGLDLYQLAPAPASDNVGRTHSTEVRLLKGNPQDMAKAVLLLQQRAASPFRFKTGADGSITLAGFPEIEQDNSWAHLRSTLAALQVNPGAPDRTGEPSTVGPCQVRYSKVEPFVLTKKSARCRYTTGPGVHLDSSLATFNVQGELTLDAAERVMTSHSVEETSFGEGALVITVTTELQRTHEGTAKNPIKNYQAWKLFPLDGSHLTTHKPTSSREVTDADRERLGSRTYPELLSSLSTAIDNQDVDGAREAISLLTILFKTDPEAMRLARAEIQKGLPMKKAEPLMGAMSMASGPEAESQLIELVNDNDLDPEVREYSVAHLGSVETPSDDVISTLAALSSDEASGPLRPQALTSLGNALRRGAEAGGSETQAQAFEQLIELSKTASTPLDKANSMLALGNTASPQALPAIAEGLASTDPMVRHSAVFALREVPGAEIDGRIISVMTSDPQPEVRVAAGNALSYRDLNAPLAEGILKAVQVEPDSAVRDAALTAVTQGGVDPDSPAYPIVDWLANNDPDAKLRERAAQFLAGTDT